MHVLTLSFTIITAVGHVPSPQEELNRIWQLASEPEVLARDPVHVGIRVLDEYFPPDDEINRLAAEVRGHPQHPDAWRLEQYLAHRSGKPSESRYDFWKAGSVWRLNTDDSPGGAKTDYVADGALRWKWAVGKQLSIFPSRDTATSKYGFDQFTAGFWMYMAVPDTAGLSLYGLFVKQVPPPAMTLTGNGLWVAEAERGDESLRLQGSTSHGFRIEEILHQTLSPSSTVRTDLVAEYDGDRVVRVRERKNGRANRQFILDLKESVGLDAIRNAVRIPSDAEGDVLRGKVSIGQVDDARGAVHTRTELQDGTRVVLARDRSLSADRNRLRLWGIVLGGAAIAGVVVLRCWKWLGLQKVRQ